MPWATPLCQWAEDCRPETCLLGVRLPAVQRARPQEELPHSLVQLGLELLQPPAALPVWPSSLASVLLPPGAWVCGWFGIKALFEVVQQTRVSRGSPTGWHVRDSSGCAVARCPWTGCCWAGKLWGHVPSAMASAQCGVSGSPRGRSGGVTAEFLLASERKVPRPAVWKVQRRLPARTAWWPGHWQPIPGVSSCHTQLPSTPCCLVAML